MTGFSFKYSVRPGDPASRAEAPDAHEVLAVANGRPQRVVAVYKSAGYAQVAAQHLNALADGQIR